MIVGLSRFNKTQATLAKSAVQAQTVKEPIDGYRASTPLGVSRSGWLGANDLIRGMTEALETASFPMKMFLQTELSRFNVRTHFGHHQDPSVNFNLVPGSDWLCGDYKKETVAQEEEMRRLKLLW